MKLNVLTSTFAAALLLGSTHLSAADFSGVPGGLYKLDPTHAYMTFSYNHLGLSNPILAFDDFSMDLNLDNENPANSTVKVTVDTTSVVAGSEVWKGHLTGSSWLDVSKHPEITFISTKVEAARDGNYAVTGDLTVKGETQSVTMNVQINAAMNHPLSGKPTVGLQADSELLRSAFGLGKNAPAVSDEITINVTAELNLAK